MTLLKAFKGFCAADATSLLVLSREKGMMGKRNGGGNPGGAEEIQ